MNLLHKISRKFSKKAAKYDEYIDIQKITADEVIKLIEKNLEKNSTILDIGSGTGYFTQELNKKYSFIQLDAAFDMCEKSKPLASAINADMHILPIRQQSFDCVISSFAMHWAEDLQKVFNEVYAILKPQGLFIFSIPIQESLREIKEVLELQNLYNIINEFHNEAFVISALSNFQVLQKIQKNEVLKYDGLIDFLRRIKSIGASQKLNDTSKVTKYAIIDASEMYEKKYSDNAGKIKIFWNNLFIVARKV
ncbi:MAG TPA: hypothetical protein DIV86_05075 [Alphaproteobacteria bacterium]|nr:hypothetical protein [Alphaproteobacteria bacterium]